MFVHEASFEKSVADLLSANPCTRAVFDGYSFQSGLAGQYPMVRVFVEGVVHEVHTSALDDDAATRVAERVWEHNGRREVDAHEFVTLSNELARLERAVQVVRNSGSSDVLLTIANRCDIAIGALRVTIVAPALRRFHGGFIGIAFRPRHAGDNFDFATEDSDTRARVELDLLWPGQSVEITLSLEPLRRADGVVAQQRE